MDCEHIQTYFKCGYTTNGILSLLKGAHRILLKKRTLERILRNKQLWWRENKTDVAEVETFNKKQLEPSSQCHGYR